MGFDRHVAAIGEQTAALRDLLARPGVDLAAPVPSCPDWNLAQLTVHVGEELRWLDEIVRTRATAMPDDTAMRDLDPTPARSPADTGAWIVEGANALVGTLREAGPDARAWTPAEGMGTTVAFHARRFAHEQVMHRVDAVLAVDAGADLPAEIPADLAVDGLAEWMTLGGLPEMLVFHPHRRALLGPGRTLRVTATDTDDPDGAWLVDLTGDAHVHRRAEAGETAAAELRGPAAVLLLVLYARLPLTAVDVRGDRALAERWLANVQFA